MRIIAKWVDKLRVRESVDCAALQVDRTALDELVKVDLPAIPSQKDRKVANAQ